MLRTTKPAACGLVVMTVFLIQGCAGPTATQKPPRPPAELYAGQPATVHGTEFPVTSAADGVRRGDTAWQQGSLDLAVYLYVQALGFEPDNATILRKIGAIHESRDNRELARKAFEMALARDKDHPATMERLALLYVQDELNDPARTLLNRVVGLEPNRWRAHNALGILADRRGEHAAAVEHYAAALNSEPDAAVVLNNLGYSRFLAGDMVGAEEDLREAIRLGAGDRAWLNLGKVQATARKYGQAFKSFLETLETAQAYNEVGEAAMRNGDHQDAKVYLENATNASPMYYERAHKNLAIVNEELRTRSPGS